MKCSQDIAERIKNQARNKSILIKDMLSELSLGINSISRLSKGYEMSYLSFAKIADSLDCSVDYLLGRTENPQSHKISNSIMTGDISLSNNSVVGDGQVGVTIHNSIPQNGQGEFLLEIFNSLDWIKRSKLLIYADELRKSE